MKIAFLDFWQGFLPNNNFFLHLFKEIFDNVEISSPQDSDIIIYSCFGREYKKYPHKKRIFFTGENKRPNYDDCDLSLSFDIDEYDGRNIRLPLWYLYIDWFKVGTYGNPGYLIPVDYIDNENEFTKVNKTNSVSAVYSNPIHIRNLTMHTFKSRNITTECYGKVKGFKALPDGEKNKLDIISNHKFNMCFENTLFPGYYTEKILHAKVVGAIPIYFSDDSMSVDFNPKCCLNINKYMDDEIYNISKLIEDMNNDGYMNEMSNEPLFINKPSLEILKFKIKNAVENI